MIKASEIRERIEKENCKIYKLSYDMDCISLIFVEKTSDVELPDQELMWQLLESGLKLYDFPAMLDVEAVVLRSDYRLGDLIPKHLFGYKAQIRNINRSV